MAWVIDNDEKHIATLGREEFDRRLAIANTKADGLEDWEERMFMRAQFKSIAMRLTPTQFAAVEGWSSNQWAKFIYKLAK